MTATPMLTDDALLRMMKSDDAEAFTFIYRRYWEPLFITAVKALRGKQEAEDIVQEVFLSLWNRRQEINIESSLAAYLQTSVRYKVIHYIEKNITRRDYLALLIDATVNSLPPTADQQLRLKEVQETIRDAVAKMPPKMREVYHLSRHVHLTHREIAEKLGISTETVKKHIQHALHLIKTALDYNTGTAAVLIFYLLV
ncbi:RNA polymerase sigma-70 factor, ECF subfamily [Chitinophaga ginsengisegetis]|uniref:RNA polymerase sigma-70 factor, ECF subfamily n=1 Tax=Chitinophaga ginsengisegetis TaxID=393003 RepID=A0A1T5NL66_9BACT|nr:RNA polymerase sigma-70 factor [Chitinophaga ginsengisegetis]SKD00888.1 RNA polymerase sigma-70 factor, ECF subfamily [Chitinophaga ginsengisegetis]